MPQKAAGNPADPQRIITEQDALNVGSPVNDLSPGRIEPSGSSIAMAERPDDGCPVAGHDLKHLAEPSHILRGESRRIR